MLDGLRVRAIIPALNEAASIGEVLADIPRWVDEVVVVDNGSTDNTAQIAAQAGARVVSEPRRGYGQACLTGLAALGACDVVVFLDGDYSDHPDQMHRLAEPIVRGEADLVIGSRVLGRRERGALTIQARFGNWLACRLIRLFWKVRYTDLGPFRAVRYTALKQLGMRDRDYGWTVEMQIQAAQHGLRIREVPVSYRRRIGKSKISGTVSGIIGAGTKILSTIFAAAMDARRRPHGSRARDRLIVFTRYPEPGKTKTRLIPALGPAGAADLQRQMTEHLLERAARLAGHRKVRIEVRFAGGSEDLVRQWLGSDPTCREQGPGDLGRRMLRAFREAFAAGAARAVIVGTDCPGITAALLEKAFDQLGRHDLVLGPAEDGGYYLIGLRRPVRQLFEGMAWGTDKVLRETLFAAERLGLSVALLEPLADVDRPEDLPVWERAVRVARAKAAPARISVIIPALNEAENIPQTLASLEGARNVEVIVADGGSTDGTVEIARSCSARVVTGPADRAKQMNIGAAAATGDILLFLHADTRLPGGFDSHVRRALARPGVVAGAFALRIDAASASLRIIERVATWRSRYLQMPYGDQAIFLRAETFRQLGGFAPMPIMEDYELIRRLHRRGRIVVLPAPAITSARRWLALGPWRTTLTNQLMVAGYGVGIRPSKLARWYHAQHEDALKQPRQSQTGRPRHC